MNSFDRKEHVARLFTGTQEILAAICEADSPGADYGWGWFNSSGTNWPSTGCSCGAGSC